MHARPYSFNDEEVLDVTREDERRRYPGLYCSAHGGARFDECKECESEALREIRLRRLQAASGAHIGLPILGFGLGLIGCNSQIRRQAA